MRPLWTLRWILLAILLYFWPVEQPSEKELIAYGAEQERQKPDPLKSPFYIERIRTQEIAAINAQTARELQRHIDAKRIEPPERVTGPIHLHAIRLQRIQTEEMPCAFPMRDTDKWLVK